MTALVLDAHLKSSLSAIRSLGRHGVPVIAASHRPIAMGLFSRYASVGFIYPSPLRDQRGFLDAIIRQSSSVGKKVILAFSDSSLLPLVRNAGSVAPHSVTLLPSNLEHFYTAFDKALTLTLAEKIGVEIPATYFCATESDVSAILPELTFPVVIKPRRTVSWRGNAGTQTGPAFAFSPEDLKSKCAAILSVTGEFPLIQEYLRGEEGSVQFVCQEGRVLAACANRRIRSVSPAGGAGILKETVPLSYQGMGERAERLVAALHWTGPIMVEFKTGRETGVPRLMEINGRFWGSLPLAAAAGVDFPVVYYRLACGEHVSPTVRYQSGIVSRHLVGDVLNMLWVLFRSDPMRLIAFPSRWKAVKDFFVLPRHCRSDVLDLRDIKPALAEVFDTLALICSLTCSRFSTHARGIWHRAVAALFVIFWGPS